MSELKDKYIEMASTRDDFHNINPDNFITPTMNEMVEEDLMDEIFEEYVKEDPNLGLESAEKERLDAAYYTEKPFTTTPGYYEQEGAFVLRVREHGINDISNALNSFDGDTTKFRIDDLDDGGSQEFSFVKAGNAIVYKSVKDYIQKMTGLKSTDKLTVRHLGLDAAEIPHFVTAYVAHGDEEKRILEITYDELKKKYLIDSKYEFAYEKHPVDLAGEKIVERKDSDLMKFLLIQETGGKKIYREIIQRITIDSAWNIDKKGYTCHVITLTTRDESTSASILDGYKAKALIREKLKSATEIMLVLNSNGISVDRTISPYGKTFNSFYYFDDIVGFLIDEWDRNFEDLPTTNHGYRPYGTDSYGRSLGVVYIKDAKGQWINLNKYVVALTEQTKANPQFNDSPELQEIGAGISDSFNLWSYDKDNIEWIDSFGQISKKSYEDRINLHKQITGIDFFKVRNCALLLGDTLFLIPPENIKNLTQVSYEKLPNLRSKGTMAKHMGNNENLLEISLYFYEEHGINGIPYKYTTPNGTVLDYRMDGLRSLIAQFKIAPFLPIENGYINDVLGIEAVALRNLSLQTVEGYPRLVKAVLTLKEFNYRVYMPDLPTDDDLENTNQEKLSMMPPMFAKSFNWDIFRYYYQRAIIAGDNLNLKEFASYEYNLEYYGNKNPIGPWIFCGPESNKGEVSFYIPKEDWLASALQLKKQRESSPLTNDAGVLLSAEARKFCAKLVSLYNNIQDFRNYEGERGKPFRASVNKLFDLHKTEHTFWMKLDKLNEFSHHIDDPINDMGGLSSFVIKDKNGKEIPWAEIRSNYIRPISQDVWEALNDSDVVTGVTVTEKATKDKVTDLYNLTWSFRVKLNTTEVLKEDMVTIKEILSKEIGKKPDEILFGDYIDLHYVMTFKKTKNNTYAELIKTNDFTVDQTTETKGYYFTFQPKVSEDEELLEMLDEIIGTNEGDSSKNQNNEEIDFYIKDYKNPANMPFDPYIEGVLCKSMGANIANSFTEIGLKAVEGQSPQYLGGQDTQLQLELITDDIAVVGALNTLPILASSMAKRYRRILPSWPIKIKSDLTRTLGISEVLIDTLEISTIDGLPGVYSIIMRLTSVDRTQRQKEALRRLDVKSSGGKISYHDNSSLSMKNYFELDKNLSQAELYPDLDLPSIQELGKLGFRFVKYAGKTRVYPDPDFYISYAYPYTSLIIKKLVKDVISKDLLNKDGQENLHSFKFKDVMGAEITTKIEAYSGMGLVSEDNMEAKLYSNTIKELEENAKKKIEKNKSLTKYQMKEIEDRLGFVAAIKKIIMTDVMDGWEIRPGWKGALSEPNTEKLIQDCVINKKANVFANEIVDIRKQAIKLIDKILNKPLTNRAPENNLIEYYKLSCEEAINDMFSEGDGRKLIELLCPGTTVKKATSLVNGMEFSKYYFKEPLPLNYLTGFAYGVGSALTGQREFKDKVDFQNWGPNHFVKTGTGGYEKARDTGEKLPYCITDRINGVSKATTTMKDAMANGVVFGGWKITSYIDTNTIVSMTEGNSPIQYTESKSNSPYSNTKKPGFIDPYYNGYDSLSDELKKYKTAILKNPINNVEAFLRNVLLFLRRMIIDGLIVSEVDILARDFEAVYNEMIIDDSTSNDGIYEPGAKPGVDNGSDLDGSAEHRPAPDKTPNGTVTSKALKETLKELGYDLEATKVMMNNVQDSFQQNFCARLIYPFVMAMTKGDSNVYNIIKNRNYDSLNALTGYVEDTTGLGDSKISIVKFLSALSGMNMSLAQEGNNEAKISDSQKLLNGLMKDVYIEAAEDPRSYVLHSFYDMLVNDKRGRLIRAFPTYYMVFIDEGRKFGSWKLHDNFYNMSSIASINIVKSRKIAADTCSITMNNMFNSYAQEPDIATTQQYADIYGMRDVFDSIFSPKTYFDKEKRLRMRQKLPDTVVLQPGIRIHVRMGYSADGASLPAVFNGKIAEVSVSEVSEIIAQGDGHELMNPLNAFGQLESIALEKAQSSITWGKDIRASISKGGDSPRNLLAQVLTARYGGIKKTIDYFFDGWWFNDNPFGIVHFGDRKFNHIFEQGELVQNLYEVCDKNLLRGMNDYDAKVNTKKLTPIINTSLEDKTFWDLLHLAANAGNNYIGAIRDFGFRSTIFLGKPNQYYAYAYDMVDNKIVEKRKPFQQFHYYDSYTDIIYNSIKASEAQMKTNAVGMWQSSGVLWGRKQSVIGPYYLDMNIYPEYQKSMTVDTQLLADGSGGIIDLNPINAMTETWTSDPNDNKVNEATARRVTINTLKSTVKDMYQGDLCVLGDPSIKPHDRMYIHDTYEDIKGMCEVEAVIHNMSIETGFTTSIMPDVIARTQDEMESSVQSLANQAMSTISFIAAVPIVDKLWGAAVHNKFVTVVNKSDSLFRGASKSGVFAKGFANTTGFKDFLDSKPGAKAFFDTLNIFPSGSNIDINAASAAIDRLSGLDFTASSSWQDLADALIDYNKIDISKHEKELKELLEKKNYGVGKEFKDGKFEEVIEQMKKTKAGLDANFDPKKLNLKDFADDILKTTDGTNTRLFDKLDSGTQKVITKWSSGAMDEASLFDDLGRVLKESDIVKAIDDDLLKVNNISDFCNDFKKVFTKLDGKVSKFGSVSSLLKGDNLLDTLKLLVKGGLKFNLATLIIDLALDVTFFIIAKNTQVAVTKFLDSIQEIDIYPLKRNNKPLIAGMNGHKGSVFGWPVVDGYNSIQGMIIEGFKSIQKKLGGDTWFSNFILEMFVDTSVLKNHIDEWKIKLGIDMPEKLSEEELLQEVYSDISAKYAANNQFAYSLMTKERVSVTDKNADTLELFNYYRITGVNEKNIMYNNKITDLHYVLNNPDIEKAAIDKRFIVAHLDNPSYLVNIPFETGAQEIPIKIQKSIIDAPLVQEEGIYLLQNLLNDTRVKDGDVKIYFKSGLRANDTSGWKSTGFRFLLEVKGSMENVEAVLKDLKEDTSIIKDKVGMFEYSIQSSKIEVKINPSIQKIVKGTS